jgi:hypothetical protein
MATVVVRVLALGVLLITTQPAWGQAKCTAKGQMGGQPFDLAFCEVAYYQGGQGVTIWFSSTPITAEERDFFQRSSSADRFRKGRNMVQVGFCPGGGSPTASPKTAKSVEIGFKHATVVSLGPQDVWVLEPPTDKQIKVERLAGELKKEAISTAKSPARSPVRKLRSAGISSSIFRCLRMPPAPARRALSRALVAARRLNGRASHPLVEKPSISGFHELKATCERFVDPARYIVQSVWSEPAAIAKASIYRDRILIQEVFNDHVKHCGPSK